MPAVIALIRSDPSPHESVSDYTSLLISLFQYSVRWEQCEAETSRPEDSQAGYLETQENS